MTNLSLWKASELQKITGGKLYFEYGPTNLVVGVFSKEQKKIALIY